MNDAQKPLSGTTAQEMRWRLAAAEDRSLKLRAALTEMVETFGRPGREEYLNQQSYQMALDAVAHARKALTL